jgi:citrate synthase
MASAHASGLEGVVVAHTELSDVDGERGRLILRGRPLENLAGHATFEDACALFLDTQEGDGRRIVRALAEARVRAHERLLADDVARAPTAMAALERALAGAPRGAASREKPAIVDGVEASASCAVALVHWWHRRARREPPAPSTRLGHAADLLRMLRAVLPRSDDPSSDETQALDTYLCTVVDHGMNASTFAARVVASTGADVQAAQLAGMCALEGPLHGGAPGPVLDMLDTIAAAARTPGDTTAARATLWIRGALDRGERLMGMGHRIYRVRDPRAFVLERAVQRLADNAASQVRERLALARVVEDVATCMLKERHPERALAANVEFFTAVLLEALGVDRALFTALFATSRIVGWTAHAHEQQRVGKLIRPASIYVGA